MVRIRLPRFGTGRRVLVTVVVPVYNTGRYLAECLDSLLAQDLPARNYEVVAVDDGSTDGSGRVLDEYAARFGNVRVIHQENSGWPGRPRNVGLAAARGTYVFFADSDDRLAPDALRRMVDFAVRHGSDVVVPKLTRLDGPPFDGEVWRRTAVDADLRHVIETLGPWKLFRRDFLERQGLRFPEGKVRLEDGILVTEAYLTARRVSVLADSDYYLKRDQDDGGNISSAPVDPQGYTASIATMMRTIRRLCADEALADELVATLYRRKALKWFGPRFARYRPWRRNAWFTAVGALVEELVPARLDEQLPVVHRVRSVLLRAGEVDALRVLAEAQDGGRRLEAVVSPTVLELLVPGLPEGVALPVVPGLRIVPEPGDLTRQAATPPAP